MFEVAALCLIVHIYRAVNQKDLHRYKLNSSPSLLFKKVLWLLKIFYNDSDILFLAHERMVSVIGLLFYSTV